MLVRWRRLVEINGRSGVRILSGLGMVSFNSRVARLVTWEAYVYPGRLVHVPACFACVVRVHDR